MVQVIAWHQRGNKPLFEPKITWYINTYMRHWMSEVPQYFARFHHDFRKYHFYGLTQEKRDIIANALQLRLSCTKPLF